MSEDSKRKNVSVLGTEDQIYGTEWKYDSGDLMLLVPATLAGMYAMQEVGAYHPGLGLAMLPLTLLVTAAYIYVTPDAEKPHERLLETVRFWRSEKELSTDTEDEDKRSDSLTHVLKVRPDLNGTHREDRALVGGVRAHASSMALATGDEWEDAVDSLEDWLSTLEFPTMIAISGRRVDSGIMTDGLDDRLTDPDVTDVPALKKVIRQHKTMYPVKFKARSTSVRSYHIFVAVGEDEARLDQHPAIEKLSELAWVGDVIAKLGVGASSMSQDQVADEQARILRRRLQTIHSGILKLDNCTSESLSGDEHGDAVEAFWRANNSHLADTGDGYRGGSRFSDAERDRIREDRPEHNWGTATSTLSEETDYPDEDGDGAETDSAETTAEPTQNHA